MSFQFSGVSTVLTSYQNMRSCWVPNICNLWSPDWSETHSHCPGNQTPGITLSPLTAQCAGHYYLPFTCRMNPRPGEDTTATHSLSSFHTSLPNTEVGLKPAFVTCLSVGNRSRQEGIPIRSSNTGYLVSEAAEPRRESVGF